MHIRFDKCTMDTGSRELLRDGQPVHVRSKAFRLLELLVEHRPNALSKDQLQDLLWPGVYVSESNLTTLVTELRQAIGDDSRAPRFIRTVYGFGYSFCGAIDTVATVKTPGPGRYRLWWCEKEIVLANGENILGRGPESVAWIDRDTVSRRHARIVVDGDAVTLEDLGSKNGTRLRGRRLEATAALADGDEIRLGSVSLTFRILDGGSSTATGSSASR